MKIIRVPIAPLHMINAYLVVSEDAVIIVDTGLPGMASRFERALGQCGKRYEDIKLIIVTHAHVDHAGGAARLRQLTGAPILAHRDDRPYYTQAKPVQYCPTGPFGKLFKASGIASTSYEGFEPDIELVSGDNYSLREFGIAGVARHTPGHTGGSVSVILEDNNMLVSDLVSSGILLGGIVRVNRPKRPPFEDDPAQVARELEKLLDQGGQHFHIGHGATLGRAQIARHIANLKRLSG
jgi:hydroxyacylglutathione hydrolase